jgi:protoheme IX farnesyltransferase
MAQSATHIELTRSAKVRAFYELLKPRLSFLVAFSSGIGYGLASGNTFQWSSMLIFLLGGFLVTGASVTINQILEKKYDAIMKRTMGRPLPTNRVSVKEATIYSIIIGVAGLGLLAVYTTPIATLLSLASLLLYSFVYTPLKRVGPVAVFVGAIPGALPPLIGWTAYSGEITVPALIIFGIQFFWQFPHFWAIAWLSDDDYKKAGFKLLPLKGGRDLNSAIQIMIYTLFLIPLGLLPAKFGLTGVNSAFVVTLCGVIFVAQTMNLIRECLPGRDLSGEKARKSARLVLFSSFFYLPIVQIAFIMDMI